eukprot:TRINITY_DN32743_c0_g1_i1.p1 TRINITY_DN32743_c0_g1~~TRINITY_DN32743_c0_g1_i1.p1  ORF type:complete len:463 (-),score=34.62 TRINITY_DN32743_c0_g1_i1:116-1504(-)
MTRSSFVRESARTCTLACVLVCYRIRSEEVASKHCGELEELLEHFYTLYDTVWYSNPDIIVNKKCPSTELRRNPFFPGVALLMYRFFKFPGECVLGSCADEAKTFQEGKQDCGVNSFTIKPWWGGEPTGDEIDWNRLSCGHDSYLKKFLPTCSECEPKVIDSVEGIKNCLRAAERSGELNYSSHVHKNPRLHNYYMSVVHVAWHRHLKSTGKPPKGATVLGFSFGKGATCSTLDTCTSPGTSNEDLAQAAVAYMLQQKEQGLSAGLVLQYEVAVAARSAVELLTNKETRWVKHDTEPNVMQLQNDEEVFKIYALGGLEQGEYLTTMQVYRLGARLCGRPTIALAHPDHLPRVYRAMKAGGAMMQEIYLSISPFNIDWYDSNSDAGGDFNIFKIDARVFNRMTQPGTRGFYHDSIQPWTRDAILFSMAEFWVYASQMRPGRNDVTTLSTDPVTLQPCTSDDCR